MIQEKNIILIADDEADLTWSMSRHIQRENPNVYIYSAVNGEQAFEMLQSVRPDLLITDLRMPGLNGFKLIEKARLLDPALKIIVISAFHTSDIENKLKLLRINGFLEKPFELKQLRKLSDALLSIQKSVPELISSN
jgi:YesN/AraC family two-component response regulator